MVNFYMIHFNHGQVFLIALLLLRANEMDAYDSTSTVFSSNWLQISSRVLLIANERHLHMRILYSASRFRCSILQTPIYNGVDFK